MHSKYALLCKVLISVCAAPGSLCAVERLEKHEGPVHTACRNQIESVKNAQQIGTAHSSAAEIRRLVTIELSFENVTNT